MGGEQALNQGRARLVVGPQRVRGKAFDRVYRSTVFSVFFVGMVVDQRRSGISALSCR